MGEVGDVVLLVVCLLGMTEAWIPSPPGPGEVEEECL